MHAPPGVTNECTSLRRCTPLPEYTTAAAVEVGHLVSVAIYVPRRHLDAHSVEPKTLNLQEHSVVSEP